MKTLIPALICLLLVVPCQARTITVDDDGPADFNNIQAAIYYANVGDEVIVADGSYTGDGNRDIDFSGKAITVRSENGPENCIIDCNGTEAEPHRGFNFHSQEPPTAVLDGFTIINGYSDDYGGGIRCKGGNYTQPTINNCVIRNCRATKGGGISCYDHVFTTISNCVISDNLGGSGIYCGWKSGPEINNCTITNNVGNGVSLWECEPTKQIISNCTITDNGSSGISSNWSIPEISGCIIANHKASGIYVLFTTVSSVPFTVTDCIISNNHSSGVSYNQCRITLSNSIITGNSSPTNGGGLHSNAWDDGATVKNCVFIGNYAKQKGGGIFSNDAGNTYVNCTIVDNTTDEYGGGYYCQNRGNRMFTNCIFWGNSAPSGPQMAIGGGYADVVISYSDVQGGQGQIPVLAGNSSLTWGTGNIDADPCFALPGDYHQLNSSPCIDAGTNSPTGGLPTTDVYGSPRSQDGDDNGSTIADMGAYEFEYDSNTPIIAISQDFFEFYDFNSQPNPDDQYLSIRNCADGTLNWEISDDSFWLEALPNEGISAGEINEVAIRVDTTTLSHGEYTGKLTIVDANSVNSPRTVLVKLHVTDNILVPEHFATIQEAIDASGDKSTIIVADGLYAGDGNKNINFYGKAITVKSENGPENCIIDCENSGRGFIFNTYEEDDSVLDGFTIINGYSSGNGGGIYINYSSPVIANCKIINCQTTSIFGGGLYCSNGSAKISNCLISSNSSGREGGGICCKTSASAIISNCIISYNTASDAGGIKIRNDNGYAATIKDCLILGNTTDGIRSEYCRPKIYNCTITNNTGVGFRCSVSAKIPTVKNCIIWGNSSGGISKSGPDTPIIIYNNVQGGWSGTGNIDADPLFVTGPLGYFYLSQVAAGQLVDSPCVDTGSDFASVFGLDQLTTRTDHVGDAGIVDMGYHVPTNMAPVANAGQDQTVYAGIDGIAEVTLDGSDSNDPDGDELTYLWSWTVDSNSYDANGVSPTIELPVGDHTIQLVVNDGTQDSEPDYVNVNVVGLHDWVVELIEGAIAEKAEALERLDAALEKELEAFETLEQLLETGDYGDWSREAVLGARWKISIAIFYEEDYIKKVLEKNIDKLQRTLSALGIEPDEGSDGDIPVPNIDAFEPAVLSLPELVINLIEEALAEKAEALERIDAALQKERKAYELLEQMLESGGYGGGMGGYGGGGFGGMGGGGYGDWNRQDILRAKSRIYVAIKYEEYLKKVLMIMTVDKLEDSLSVLGTEAYDGSG